jgi:uncharacterized protein (DUF433 family)
MAWQEHIETNPDIIGTGPVIRGTDVAVEEVLALLAEGADENSLLERFPGLTKEDIRACLKLAHEVFSERRTTGATKSRRGSKPSREEALEELREFRRGRRLNGISVRELIEEGRRF